MNDETEELEPTGGTATAVLEREPEVPERPSAARPDARPVNVWLTCLAVFGSAAAAGWMAGGVFVGFLPRLVGLAGAAMGAGAIAFSFRTSRPSIVQYLTLPAALVVGALLVIPDATGGTANLPGLVAEAIRAGGVAQPPVPFDPGWRFIFFTLIAFLAASGASLGTGFDRPKLGLFFPVPLIGTTALIQPPEETMLSVFVALVLLVGALAVSFGVDLGREGATSGGFEVRRLGRGAGAAVVLVVALALLSQAGFLFPDVDREQVIPPKKPEVQPPQEDRVLFTVSAERQGPWRLGVLDVYDGEAWLLPPYDTERFEEVPASGRIDDPGDAETYDATFRVNDLEGHVLPTVAEPASVRRDGFAVLFDPRAQMLRLPESRARQGTTYAVSAPVPPTGAELSEAPEPPPDMSAFTQAPDPPQEVVGLLAEAPTTNAWDRLQFVRTRFYENVVAAGAGEPVDVPPGRVAELLLGDEGTPYEITAAEVLLARWAGAPARVGYGFHAGDRVDEAWEVHPSHGATWLEAYFSGHGWVPIIGKPPKAKASTSDEQKQQDPTIRPSDELALVVYVPIRLESIRLLYEIVRYYVSVTLPIIAGLAVLWGFFPYVVKLARRFRRRRWAEGTGPLEGILVEYAELRDACTDLGIGDTRLTPLEFCGVIARDTEHRELAWLVTRTLWGDLRRDIRAEDAEAAQDLARSVTKRVKVAQPALTRIISWGSRASLRDPYTTNVPNLWPPWATPGAGRRAVLRFLRTVGRAFGRARAALPIGGLVALLLFGACGGGEALVRAASLPDPLVPDGVGSYAFEREEEAETAFGKAGEDALVRPDGRVYTIRRDGEVLGALQAAVFEEEFRVRDDETREGVLEAIKRNIGTGRFERKRIGTFTIEEMALPEQRILLWLSPDGGYYELFVARQGFEEAERVFTALLAFQTGEGAEEALARPTTELLDPRRGAPR